MKRILISLFIQAFIASFAFSQTNVDPAAKKMDDNFKKKFARVTSFLFDEKYEQALPVLLEMDSEYPGNANLNFMIGYCYLKSPGSEAKKAILHFEKASVNTSADYQEGYYKETRAPMETVRHLAEAFHLNYEFGAAIATYERYKTDINLKEVSLLNIIDRQIEICNNAMEMVKNPVNMTVSNLGESINSPYPDYAPVLTADESTIIFTSRRPESTGGKITDDGKYYEDIYIAEKDNYQWQKPKNIGPPINTNDHEATIGLSPDGQQLLIYKYDKEVGFGDIFFSKLMGDRWTLPQRFGSDINTQAFEPHASMSADGQLIYFISNRQGGQGGRDIYFCKKLPTGEWGLAQNIGSAINTRYDEDAVYIHPNGTTLFFSSMGHKTMGGFDIFFSELDKENGVWMPPQNIGYPVNTTRDDIFFVPSADGKRAYYSSFKKEGLGDLDIYMITFPEQKEIPLTVYKGVLTDENGKVPNDVLITVTDNESGELVGNYIPNSATGKYLFILPPGKNYNVTYESEGHLFHSENIYVPDNSSYSEINRPVELKPLVAGATITLNNIFFEYDKTDVQAPQSVAELEKLVKLMNNKKIAKIEIAGHTDSKGTEEYNKKLSQQRTQSVVDYLIKQGVEASRLVAKGYGPAMPVAPNTRPDGSDNPEGRALNRRVELKILEMGK